MAANTSAEQVNSQTKRLSTCKANLHKTFSVATKKNWLHRVVVDYVQFSEFSTSEKVTA